MAFWVGNAWEGEERDVSPCTVADYIRDSGLPEGRISQLLDDLRFAKDLQRRNLLTEDEMFRLATTITDWDQLDILVSDEQAGFIEQMLWLRDIQRDYETGLITDDYAEKLNRLDPSWRTATFTLSF